MIGSKRIWAVVCVAGVLWVSAPAVGLGGDEGAFGHISEPIPGQYIIVLKDNIGDVALEAALLSALYNFTIKDVYEHALKGFAAVQLSAANALQLRLDPQVELVEQDRMVYLPRVGNIEQNNPALPEVDLAYGLYTWGLDRIDQRDLPLDGSYYAALTGAGVRAYVIDSGIRSTHVDFGGRVVSGHSVYLNDPSTEDCYGHGTHVAGTLGGFRWGVAKQVTLVPVRVFTCSGGGGLSEIMAGVEWVTKDHVAGQPAVANMSIQLPANDALDRAVRGSIADGISYAVAAGNSNGQDACLVSPAGVAAALTAAASDQGDVRSWFSNKGPCVDLYAPGEYIKSAWFTSDTATWYDQGTSMASPHVAGAAALYLQNHPTAAPSEVHEAVISIATINKIQEPGPPPGGTLNRAATLNRLLYIPGP